MLECKSVSYGILLEEENQVFHVAIPYKTQQVLSPFLFLDKDQVPGSTIYEWHKWSLLDSENLNNFRAKGASSFIVLKEMKKDEEWTFADLNDTELKMLIEEIIV
jgi:hypothetical protein